MSNTGYVKVDKEIVLRACNNFEADMKEYRYLLENQVIEEMSYLIRKLKWFHKTPNLAKIQDEVNQEVDKRVKENWWYTVYTQLKELAQAGHVLYINVWQAQFVNMWKERCKV